MRQRIRFYGSKCAEEMTLSACRLPAPERNVRLAHWDTASGPAGRLSHPQRAEEHLLPLHVVAGAAGDGVGRKVFSDEVMRTQISAFRFD